MAHLRIVTWNCGMALVRKASNLLALDPGHRGRSGVFQEVAGCSQQPRVLRLVVRGQSEQGSSCFFWKGVNASDG